MKKTAFALLALITLTLLSGCFQTGDIVYAKKDGAASHSPYECDRSWCNKTFTYQKSEALEVAPPHPELGTNILFENEEAHVRVKNKDGVFGWIWKACLAKKPPND